MLSNTWIVFFTLYVLVTVHLFSSTIHKFPLLSKRNFHSKGSSSFPLFYIFLSFCCCFINTSLQHLSRYKLCSMHEYLSIQKTDIMPWTLYASFLSLKKCLKKEVSGDATLAWHISSSHISSQYIHIYIYFLTLNSQNTKMKICILDHDFILTSSNFEGGGERLIHKRMKKWIKILCLVWSTKHLADTEKRGKKSKHLQLLLHLTR